ncbi:hypothetical protein HELRODRAFT_158579 [Helobdella robusta]|uniref:Uncharacterized protein n=1 Tax=Helobdella robusta TaxID=6412 RepID=T1EMY9_HELRO|nr:hypothetical protein HELRODRAFT_158579 [Helobdella robusta]ESO12134.1 hypothetical protein HELRODRAFT_158579 [Helobdella robusta]
MKQQVQDMKIATVNHFAARMLNAHVVDEETSSNIYKTQFEAATISNKWNEKDWALALVLILRGPVAKVLQTIFAKKQFNFTTLKLRYGKEHMKLVYKTQLRNRTAGRRNSTASQDIKQLMINVSIVRPGA